MLSCLSLRTRQLNIRLSDEESARIEELADHYGLTPAAVTRMLWKREEQALRARSGGTPRSKPKRKARR
jgi:hypothetical protein